MATATAETKRKHTAVVDVSTWLLISYRRFSFEGQKHGRSTDRQNEAWDNFVEDEKRQHSDRTYILHSLPMDEGMSALYGEHRKRGHLGKFVNGIESGEIKVIPGRTILFIEEVRRLSREGSKDALQNTIFKLFDAGITIQFANGLQFSNAINKKTPGWLGVLTTLLDLAYEESRQKRDYLTDVWKSFRKRARETKDAVVGNYPKWIRIVGREYNGDKVVKTGKYELIPEAGEALVKMFKMAASGLGFDLITQKLNEEAETKGAWAPKRKNQNKGYWNRTYVQLTLRNRAVIGDYQPHRRIGGKYGKRVPEGQPIQDFYPNALKKHTGLFGQVQKMLASKAGISQPGANKHCPNAVTGIVKCGYCGGPMHYGPKGGNKERGYYYRLYCGNSKERKSPKCPMMDYAECVNSLIDGLRLLKSEQVLPKKDKKAKLCEKLRQQEQQVAAHIEEIDEQIANYVGMIGRTKDAELQIEYERSAIKLRDDKRVAVKQLSNVRSQLQDAERDTNSVKQWQSGLKEELKDELGKDPETRSRLNNHLRQFIDHIDIFAKGYPLQFRDDTDGNMLYYFDAVEDEMADHGQANKLTPKEKKDWNAYKQWARAELRTKRARFIRVYFKQHGYTDDGGGLRFVFPYIDIAPEGSIGGSSRATATLWNEFKDRPKKPRPR